MPAASLWLFASAVLAAVLHVGFVISPTFADFFNEHIASFFRALFAHMTGWIPFSLAETLILFVPVIFVVVLVVALRCAAKGWRRAMYCVLALLSVVAVIYTTFVATFAAGYHGTPLSENPS